MAHFTLGKPLSDWKYGATCQSRTGDLRVTNPFRGLKTPLFTVYERAKSDEMDKIELSVHDLRVSPETRVC